MSFNKLLILPSKLLKLIIFVFLFSSTLSLSSFINFCLFIHSFVNAFEHSISLKHLLKFLILSSDNWLLNGYLLSHPKLIFLSKSMVLYINLLMQFIPEESKHFLSLKHLLNNESLLLVLEYG